MFLGKEGSIKKHLSKLDYELTYIQNPIDEIDLNIKDLSMDLRDGVIIGKLLEILNENIDILKYFRFNPGAKTQIPKMSREYNWKFNLKCLNKLKIDSSFCYNGEKGRNLTQTELGLGHREQTLIVVTRIMRGFREKFCFPNLEILEKLECFVEIFLVKDPERMEIAKNKMIEVRVNWRFGVVIFLKNFPKKLSF